MPRAWKMWIVRKAAEIAAEGNDYEHPWPLRPRARLYVDLEACFVNVYNNVKVGPDPVGETAVHIEARPGYVIEPSTTLERGMVSLHAVVRDPRNHFRAESPLYA